MIRGILAFGWMAAPLLAPAPAGAAPAKATPAKTSAADLAAVYKAAGFHLAKGKWGKCGDPGTAGYGPGKAEMVGDLNGDGQPEAVVTEDSSFCYGNTGTAFALVSKGPAGWKLVMEEVGVASFLKTRGAGGWPDIEVGGPGFCFPVYRWNGRQYAPQRFQYEGKRCRP